MKFRLMDIVVCPCCRNTLELEVFKKQKYASNVIIQNRLCRYICHFYKKDLTAHDIASVSASDCTLCMGNDIAEGLLKCSCGSVFPIINSIPRMLSYEHKNINLLREKYNLSGIYGQEKNVGEISTDANSGFIYDRSTKDLYDKEWNLACIKGQMNNLFIEHEGEDFLYKAQISKEFLRDKFVLDAGCGMGTLLRYISAYARECVGLEISVGIDRANENCRDNPFIHLIQADIHYPPLRKSVFDYVYSKGVMHYVPAPRAAFSVLASLAAEENGGIFIDMYPHTQKILQILNNTIRGVTIRLPSVAVLALSYALSPFFSSFLTIFTRKKRYVKWHIKCWMIFNWFSAKYHNTSSNKELIAWFREEGFNNYKISPIPVGLAGYRGDSVSE